MNNSIQFQLRLLLISRVKKIC